MASITLPLLFPNFSLLPPPSLPPSAILVLFISFLRFSFLPFPLPAFIHSPQEFLSFDVTVTSFSPGLPLSGNYRENIRYGLRGWRIASGYLAPARKNQPGRPSKINQNHLYKQSLACVTMYKTLVGSRCFVEGRRRQRARCGGGRCPRERTGGARGAVPATLPGSQRRRRMHIHTHAARILTSVHNICKDIHTNLRTHKHTRTRKHNKTQSHTQAHTQRDTHAQTQ